jgi:DNA adenine methylase
MRRSWQLQGGGMNAVSDLRRPALRYLGGKWRLAPWIIEHFPPHRIYVEPFGGAASVLLRKPRSYAEIYNDLDGDVVNLFRVLREPRLAARLVSLVQLTPYSRDEFELSYEATNDRVERARRLVVRSFMGHGSNAPNIERNTGFRANAFRNGTTPSGDWANYPEALAAVARRIQSGVSIERRPALDVIRRFDSSETLIYADPPYMHGLRSDKRVRGQLYCAYAHELSDGDHGELLQCLTEARSMVVLSGYDSDLYRFWLSDWRRVERASYAGQAQPRTEVLWLNPAAAEAVG